MATHQQLLIKGGQLHCAAGAGVEPERSTLDMRIADGVIKEVGARLAAETGEMVFDASGLWIMPGLIDLHTHLRDLGQSEKEDISTGTRCAAAGGYTTVLAMANTDPPTDTALVLGRVNDLIKAKAHIEVLPVCCVTRGMAGQELTNFVELTRMGAAAFSDDGMPISNLAVLRRALEYVQLTDAFIISHPEDKDLSASGSMNECAAAIRLGLPGIPTVSESACIAREIEVARYCGGRLHFAHVSAAASVQLIRQAKQAGMKVTADATPHHLTLLDENISDFDTSYKMNPPLRGRADQDALVAGLRDGTLDAIATDHAPHTVVEKGRTFDQAPFGVIGLETAFPLLYERLVMQKLMSELDLLALFTSKPARVLNRRAPELAPGHTANLAVFDPNVRWFYDPSRGFSKSRNSPFNGRAMRGRVVATFFRGQLVHQDKTQAKRIAGQLVDTIA